MAIAMVVCFNLDITAPDFLCFNRIPFSQSYENYSYNESGWFLDSLIRKLMVILIVRYKKKH